MRVEPFSEQTVLYADLGSQNSDRSKPSNSVYNVAGPLAARLAHENFFAERFNGGRLATDALRHLIGSAIVVRDQGTGRATAGGAVQEFIDTALGGDDRDRFMDNFNNEVGRRLYQELKTQLGRAPSNEEIGAYMLQKGIDEGQAIKDYGDPRIPARFKGQ